MKILVLDKNFKQIKTLASLEEGHKYNEPNTRVVIFHKEGSPYEILKVNKAQ